MEILFDDIPDLRNCLIPCHFEDGKIGSSRGLPHDAVGDAVCGKEGSGVYARNVHFEETNPNGRWAHRTSAYLLRHVGESNLSIAFWLQDPERYSAYPIELDIYANQQIIAHQTFTDGGTHQISVVLPKLQTDTLELTLVCNAQYIYEKPDRILSLFLNSIKLE